MLLLVKINNLSDISFKYFTGYKGGEKVRYCV